MRPHRIPRLPFVVVGVALVAVGGIAASNLYLAVEPTEVVAMDERSVAWQHVTHSFGEPYGAQRGGVEVSLCGPPDARVRLDVAGRSVRIELGGLAERLADGPVAVGDGAGLPGTLTVQPAIGALLGLGARELDVSFQDDDALADAAFYYARAFQVDGELAWSSPLWVRPAGSACTVHD